MPTRVALIAHDQKKGDIVRLTGEYVDTLRCCELIATGSTGACIEQAVGSARRRPADRRAARRRPRQHGHLPPRPDDAAAA
jgi:hypothetical protein